MFRRLFVAAMLAAVCAGLATTVFQAWRVTPLIFAAEAFDAAAPAPHGGSVAADREASATSAHDHDEAAWVPEDGFERTAYTIMANMLMAAGYALVIGAVSVVFVLPITFGNGLLWGLGAFAAFTLAPTLGLPPGLPGMPVADTLARQLWWAGTALSTGGALVLAAKLRTPWVLALAFGLLVLPHLVPAPAAPEATGHIPPGLAAAFVAAVIGNGAIFFAVLGLAFGWINDRLLAGAAPLPAGAPA